MNSENMLRLLIILLLAVFIAPVVVYSQDFECNYTQITDTVDSDTRSVSTNLNGTAIVFVSDQDFESMNADGNKEVFLLDINTLIFTQVTDTTVISHDDLPAISADRTLIAFKSNLDSTGKNPSDNEIFLYDIHTDSLSQITTLIFPDGMTKFSADGN